MIPGEFVLKETPIICNAGRETEVITVLNKGDRPIQVGSHFHFYEVNQQLFFERVKAFGMHLNIPAGTAIRFEPGDAKDVEVVKFAGSQLVYGLNNLTNGSIKEGPK